MKVSCVVGMRRMVSDESETRDSSRLNLTPQSRRYYVLKMPDIDRRDDGLG
jgi:hypothetical protein